MMQIVKYPHPALRWKAKPLRMIDGEVRGIAQQMLEMMYAAKGVGLAGNQVALPYRLFVLNPTGDAEQKEHEHVFLNPVVRSRHKSAEGEEGCLSLPGLNGPVWRAKKISISAYDLAGHEIQAELTGLTARVFQHEADHLDGVLFIDRMTELTRAKFDHELRQFEREHEKQVNEGVLPCEQDVICELQRLESLRT